VRGLRRLPRAPPAPARRPAHLRGRQRGGPGDRLDHEALERALAQLSHQQPGQQSATRLVGRLEQRPQLALSPLG